MEKITAILEKIGLPFAYDHFAEGESPAVHLLSDSQQ